MARIILSNAGRVHTGLVIACPRRRRLRVASHIRGFEHAFPHFVPNRLPCQSTLPPTSTRVKCSNAVPLSLIEPIGQADKESLRARLIPPLTGDFTVSFQRPTRGVAPTELACPASPALRKSSREHGIAKNPFHAPGDFLGI